MMRICIGSVLLFALARACSSDLDCNLNGLCVNQQCKCDSPWNGASCEAMTFKPISFPQGYGMSPNTTTWGGNVLQDDSGTWHLLVSRMTNECPLKDWTVNSRIDHATSKSIEGPYEFQDVAINTWSHNSAPVKLKDGTYAIFHIGHGTGAPDGGHNCTEAVSIDGGSPGPIEREYANATAAYQKSSGGSTIHTSPSLNGPWEPLIPNYLGGCNNPAPWVHPDNGTVYIVCGSSLLRTEDIRGNWTEVAKISHSGGPSGGYEDPFVYTDHRGRWHVLYHVYTMQPAHTCVNTTVSAHIFSEDGYTWHTTPTQPYTSQLQLQSGATITVATRERPKLVFNASGIPTHLVNGVCGAAVCAPTHCSACKQTFWDYTLVAPLAV